MTAVRPEDLPTADTDVLVVGAGPTGLMAGLVLARTGLMAVVADQKSGPHPGVAALWRYSPGPWRSTTSSGWPSA